MIEYITTVSDFTDIDPLNMYQRLKKVEEPREGPCIIGILDLYAKNYYFSSVLTLGVNKPESVRVSTKGVMNHLV
jgi:hypothetical protein